jgi:hypothetical protein
VAEPDNPAGGPAPIDVEPGSLAWRIQVATLAHRFFGLIHDANTARVIDQPADAGQAVARPVAYFNLYLQKIGFPSGGMTALSRILAEMERAGLLMRAGWRNDMVGWPMQGQLYISQGVRSAQTAGHLWLSEVLDTELIIESYNTVTFLISGGEGKPAGTAFALDRTHMVTNRHVIEGLVGPVEVDRRRRVPSFSTSPSRSTRRTRRQPPRRYPARLGSSRTPVWTSRSSRSASPRTNIFPRWAAWLFVIPAGKTTSTYSDIPTFPD